MGFLNPANPVRAFFMPLALNKLSILIVEDLKPMQTLLSSVLDSMGFATLYLASNGEEGYEMFRRHNPDIVLTDWMMNPDGLYLTDKIRNHMSSPNKMCPVILITGYSSLSRVNEARNAGVTEFLVKPFTANDIAKRIAHVVNAPRDFVELTEFFGPDRRRRKGDDYAGPRRRDSERAQNGGRNAGRENWTIKY